MSDVNYLVRVQQRSGHRKVPSLTQRTGRRRQAGDRAGQVTQQTYQGIPV